MRMHVPLLTAVLLLSPVAALADDMWQGRKAAFFGITLLDTSTEGAVRGGSREDELERVTMLEEYVRDALEAEGLVLADLEPVEEELARTFNPSDCNGCDIRMAQQLGAEYAVVSEVQKVSNLILSMNLYIRDVETGRNLRGLAVDIRGNTDESWTRGMSYILRNAIFRES